MYQYVDYFYYDFDFTVIVTIALLTLAKEAVISALPALIPDAIPVEEIEVTSVFELAQTT